MKTITKKLSSKDKKKFQAVATILLYGKKLYENVFINLSIAIKSVAKDDPDVTTHGTAWNKLYN